MKRALVLALGLIALPALASAQMTVNVGGGITSSTWTGDGAEPGTGEEKSSRTGFFGGANVAIPVGARFAVSPGAYYVQKGVSFSDGTDEFNVKANYIEIPVLANVILSSSPNSMAVNIFVGPTFGFEIGCDLEGSSGGTSASVSCDDAGLDERQSFDLGALAGAGVSFPVGENLSIGISGGVDFGLRTLDSSADPETIKNRTIFGGVHVGIPIG